MVRDIPVLNWPYIEGLRLDEAMHPLTTVVTGLYGKSLPNQNGAPLRIFIPWKYGFKSAKSIVKIKLKKICLIQLGKMLHQENMVFTQM